MEKIIIIGAGDGGRLVSQLIKQRDDLEVIGFIDDARDLQGEIINGYKVVGASSDLDKFAQEGFVVTLGKDMKARRQLFAKAKAAGLEPLNIIHPSAIIDSSAKIGSGVIILPNCVVNPFVTIGENAFLFTGTIIEHDAQIGDNAYFAPGVKLAGGVKVGNDTFWGINSSTIEGITVGSNVIVGAGTCLRKDVANNTAIAGNPARILRKVF